LFASGLFNVLLLIFIAAALAWLFCVIIVSRGRKHALNYDPDLPQRFHHGHVPRIGGLAVALASVAAWLGAWVLAWTGALNNAPLPLAESLLWLWVCIPAFAAGLIDDLTQKLGVRWRLLASMGSAALGCWLLGLAVPRLGIAGLDGFWMSMPWFGMALAFFGMAGLPHAMNIIDGYNGLAGMVAVMVCSAIAYVALQQGDRVLAGYMVCVVGATLGFLFWNYPRGLIFVGDGGSYFWGIVIAVASITLVQRHQSVSPWFVMLLLIYPVWETIFSIYRKLARGQSPGIADSMHFHQLVYKRIVRGVFHDNETRQMLMRNNRTSPYLWAFAGMTVAPAVLFWYSTPILIFFCLVFVVSYVAAYLMIVRFKVPRWLRSLSGRSSKKPPA
jgi:UDP-GlcNAc:undecaprenyl-phosphate/decaprenyl-phosphate GlcNAc-1-phosphate transferase